MVEEEGLVEVAVVGVVVVGVGLVGIGEVVGDVVGDEGFGDAGDVLLGFEVVGVGGFEGFGGGVGFEGLFAGGFLLDFIGFVFAVVGDDGLGFVGEVVLVGNSGGLFGVFEGCVEGGGEFQQVLCDSFEGSVGYVFEDDGCWGDQYVEILLAEEELFVEFEGEVCVFGDFFLE